MKELKRLFVVLLVLAFSNQTTQLSANPLTGQTASKGSIDAGQLAMILLSSFIIGNVVAWSMGAYPHDFPVRPFSPHEKEMIRDLSFEIKEYPAEADTKVELGQLYFQHNELDQAGNLLEEAVNLEPDNGEALAIYSANEAKQAGAMWDFTWGIWKLSRMDKVVEGLNRAVEIAPDNVTVRLYRMNTLVGFKNKKNNFHKVFEDESWFLEQSVAEAIRFPEEVNREFYKVLSQAYDVAADLADSPDVRENHLKKAELYRTKLTPIALHN